VTLETKQKLTCIIENSISNIKFVITYLFKLQTFFQAAPWVPEQIFAIGASRMGNLLKPKWCFSQTPFDKSIALDNFSSDLDPERFLMTVSFVSNPEFRPYWNTVFHVLCETLN